MYVTGTLEWVAKWRTTVKSHELLEMVFINKNPNCISFVRHSSLPPRIVSAFCPFSVCNFECVWVLRGNVHPTHSHRYSIEKTCMFQMVYLHQIYMWMYEHQNSALCSHHQRRRRRRHFHHLYSFCENTQNNYISIHKQMHLNCLHKHSAIAVTIVAAIVIAATTNNNPNKMLH